MGVNVAMGNLAQAVDMAWESLSQEQKSKIDSEVRDVMERYEIC